MTSSRSLLTLLTVPPLFFAVGCGSDVDPQAAANPGTVAVADAASDATAEGAVVIIDVRTPQEYAEGHLAGAVNHNVEDGALEAALDDLDPDGEYVVYCRSGNRSAIAAALMAEKGFDSVVDLGSLDEAAAATGVDVVTGP